jgi:hypothetical protein
VQRVGMIGGEREQVAIMPLGVGDRSLLMKRNRRTKEFVDGSSRHSRRAAIL